MSFGAGTSDLNHGHLKLVDAMFKQHIATLHQSLQKELRHVRRGAAASPTAAPTMKFGSDMQDESYAQYF